MFSNHISKEKDEHTHTEEDNWRSSVPFLLHLDQEIFRSIRMFWLVRQPEGDEELVDAGLVIGVLEREHTIVCEEILPFENRFLPGTKREIDDDVFLDEVAVNISKAEEHALLLSDKRRNGSGGEIHHVLSFDDLLDAAIRMNCDRQQEADENNATS